MTLTLLHTAEAHRAAFDDLAVRIAPGAELRHVVRPDWLSRAQDADASVQGEIAQAVRAAPGAVLCTCTTLGPLAEGLGILRIDAPMMAKAAQVAAGAQGDIIMAYCVDSTLVAISIGPVTPSAWPTSRSTPAASSWTWPRRTSSRSASSTAACSPR